MGVYPNKSTWVDLGTSNRVGSVLLDAVDPSSNKELKSDFTASRLQTDFKLTVVSVCALPGLSVSEPSCLLTHMSTAIGIFLHVCLSA